MTTKILVPFRTMKLIEEKLKTLEMPASQPTIRRALNGFTSKKSKEQEYKLIRAIALQNGGVEVKKEV